MSSRAAPRICVLKGGLSAEREVSLSSGHECAQALRVAGFEVIELDARGDVAQRLTEIAPDIVFNALHGRFGEDGCVQGILEWLRIPYTHSGVLASALAMDKARAKAAYVAVGLPVVDSRIAPKAEVMAAHVLPPPYVVKPNNEGSSVGVYLVQEGANTPPRLSDDMPAEVMVEAFAPGRELTTTVLGDRALTVTDILTDGWYDYDAKYKPGGSRHVLPADVPQDIFDACLDYAMRAHRVLGCRGISRTDFRWDESRGLDGLILLETNTQPGMTPTSLVPEQAAQCGTAFADLCRLLVEDASCDR
ncbi:D-alanine--D-alanine ligase [Roseibaca ekhonensis]|uniref:D-alanine--D-alanine ligase n=1 Tax=Roseinatronobacter ekhonensis TaxID=254356 RepID=A0A3B0MTQ2_9RHOB|nr:D-alanine--D-alanine ligase [Roseibaca ekhonensis]SUZ32204.1 D-alanine--D-alanine ligase [Roseibaca ekhonensis]